MTTRRSRIERLVVAIVSATIALIFVFVTKPWTAPLPKDAAPKHGTSHSSTPAR